MSHQEDLKRVSFNEGTIYEAVAWVKNGESASTWHHPTEPAIQYKSGDWVWAWMGKEHRLDGPAMYWNGEYEWAIHGKKLTREAWEKHPVRLEWLKKQVTEL